MRKTPRMGTAAGGAAEEAADSRKAKETLSQFIARILDQLAISAWLPAVFIVLSGYFLISFSEHVEGSRGESTAGALIADSIGVMTNTSVGGALFLLFAITSLTMITQAFTFEAIRLLEGYWGTNSIVERIAGKRASRFAERRRLLDDSYNHLTKEEWVQANRKLKAADKEARQSGIGDRYSPTLRKYLGAEILGTLPPTDQLQPDERGVLSELRENWVRLADPDTERRRINLDKRRRDYPLPERALPTRLGSILRAHEDETGQKDIESFVQRVYDQLPISLRVDHDDHRSRLDLYCSMVFIMGLLALAYIARLMPLNLGYSLVAFAFFAMLAMIMYRAALASARAYGQILVTIAEVVASENDSTPRVSEPESSTNASQKLDPVPFSETGVAGTASVN